MRPGRPNLGIIGCGQMARALLGGFVGKSELLGSVYLYDIEKEKAEKLAREYSGQAVDSSRKLVDASDLILIAVKPDQVVQVLRQMVDGLRDGHMVISIAAGISINTIAAEMDRHLSIIRVMPNTPCLVGEGAIALSPGPFVKEEELELARNLFATVGTVHVVPESYMDAVTAVSGSGPAYLFLVAEAMIDAAVAAGLPRNLARSLVVETLAGAAAMLKTGEHPVVLREQVTSPGGTTAAGIKALEEHGIRSAFYKAIHEARERSAKLGK